MQNRTRSTTLMILAALAVTLGAAVAVEAADGKVNINEAGVEQLALLPRVGPAVAQRIVDFREQNGKFKTTADLMLVRGIGEKTFEQLEPYVALTGATTLSEKVSLSRGGEDDGGKR